MLVQKHERVIEIAIALVAFLNRALPKGAFFCIGQGHRFDHWQCQFAFAEIIAHVLACGGRHALVVKQIIDDLKGDPERVAVVKERLHKRVVCACNDPAHFGGCGEQCCRFAADDLEIDAFVCGEILGGGQLQHLAFGNGGGRIGQNIEHP